MHLAKRRDRVFAGATQMPSAMTLRASLPPAFPARRWHGAVLNVPNVRICLAPSLRNEAVGNAGVVLRGRPGFGCHAFFVSAFPCASESERALSNMHLNAMFKEVLMLQDWLFVLFFFS